MMTKTHCDCDDDWVVGLISTPLDYRDMVSDHIRPKCAKCNKYPWYDAYEENEARDLKWMNN